MDLVKKGSETAKAGFQNEKDVVNIFNQWETNKLARDWLVAMNYDLKDIEYVKAEKIKGSYKADIQVQVRITIKFKSLIDCQNIQVKLVSNAKGFNQIDKRWLVKYKDMWNIPNDVYTILQHYVGELPPYKANTKDSRRMFINEMTIEEQNILLTWLNENKYLIVSDILKGRGQFSAEWVLVIKKTNFLDWVLKPINFVMNHYSNGDIGISNNGNIHLGKITVQRKGGDGGRETAKMLQFKIDPTELFNIA
ncbi:MAG: type II restriction endonuclease [Alphaproteobacteria bacterium]|nr:type II restriction endonuclease [Alphaproteobacteria bacterium]